MWCFIYRNNFKKGKFFVFNRLLNKIEKLFHSVNKKKVFCVIWWFIYCQIIKKSCSFVSDIYFNVMFKSSITQIEPSFSFTWTSQLGHSATCWWGRSTAETESPAVQIFSSSFFHSAHTSHPVFQNSRLSTFQAQHFLSCLKNSKTRFCLLLRDELECLSGSLVCDRLQTRLS